MDLIIRQYHAHLAKTVAITMFFTPIPKIPTIESIMTSLGKDNIISHILMITSSTQPLKNPDIKPRIPPIPIVHIIVIKDIIKVVFAPYINLDKTHLPN